LGSDEVSQLRTRLGRATPLVGVLIVVAILALLCAGLYATDRYAHRRGEQLAAKTLQPRLGTPALPHVDIEGFPFLTQVASGSVGTMRVAADQLGVTNNAPVTLVHADLVMSDVVTSDWFKTMKITHAEGTSLLSYATLSSLAGAPLTYGDEGRVEIVVHTSVVRREVEAVISGLPRLNAKEQTMTLTEAGISVEGVKLPDFTAQALLAALLRPIPLKGMPLGLTVSKLVAAEDGMHVDLVGDDLAIPS
jgi:LmeA-like phospholipid-binding